MDRVALKRLMCGFLMVIAGMANAQEGDVAAAIANQTGALNAARVSQVDVLSPKNFAAASESLTAAQKALEKKAKPEKIREAILQSEKALAQAKKAAEATRTALATVLKTRDDAVAAQAPKFAPEAWQKAAERFNESAMKVESGDVPGGQKRAAEADVLLRDAELAGIKGDVLGETRALIAQADQSEVDEVAPRTLAAAKKYLAQSEAEINRNRYDADVPRSLAQQATYEARHALYLAEIIRPLLDKKKDEHALEELMLSWEEPLKRMATELELPVRFDNGYLRPMQDSIDRIIKLQKELRAAKQDSADREAQVALLNREVKRLEEKLGGVSDERVALQRQLSAQAQQRATIMQVENSFTPNEARVSRQGEDLLISLFGITFPVGKANIDPVSFGLMSKLIEDIKLFPNASLIIEGHTDGDGSDSANLILSQDRADAVRQYLISNAGLDSEKVTSIGYGESRPVASNQTIDGKARNRRIDVVIHIGSAL
jgi:OmpA-OmpF porin, OOP family